MYSVAEMLHALQLSNLIACVVRDYLLIIGRPFCCSSSKSGPGFVEMSSVILSWEMKIQLSMGWFWVFFNTGFC